jgi:glyoxylase-like metal-dependent hydrolase (beta-lactamase superfamily II)
MEAAFHIGRYQVFRLEEWQGGFCPPEALFADFDAEIFSQHAAAFEPDFYRDGLIYGYVQSWLIDTGDERIIVDTGVGNGKSRPGIPIFENLDTPFLEQFKAIGVSPSDIDKVFCTHLHIDHVGWNTERQGSEWRATFPNARYYFSRDDEEAWNPSKPGYATRSGANVNINVFEDSVAPIIAAGLGQLIGNGDSVAAGMNAWAMPGHTPGHMVLEVECDGDRALFTGDILHHPIQIFHPDWNSVYCEDRKAAATTRRRVLEYASLTKARIVPAHFGQPHSIFVDRDQNGKFRPIY